MAFVKPTIPETTPDDRNIVVQAPSHEKMWTGSRGTSEFAFGRLIEAATLLAMLLLVIIAFFIWQSMHQDDMASDLVARTHAVQTALEATLSHAVDSETGARAFATTGNETYLDPYWAGQRANVKDIETLRKLIVDNHQQERLNLLEQQLIASQDYVTAIVDERRRVGAIIPNINGALLEGKRKMDALRATIDEMQNNNLNLLALRLAKAERARRQIRILMTVTAAVGMVLMMFAGLLLRREAGITVQMNRHLKTLNIELEQRTRESRQAEEETRILNRELERRVELRTAEISLVNTKLAESVKELEAFAYSVSHDLRAPLRHMDGFLSLLCKRSYSSLDDSAKHYVDSTLEASKRMGQLIDDLLHFSRLGRTEIRKMPVDLNEVVEEVRKELEPETRDRRILWRLGRLPVVLADQAMLRQAIENLVANALKFTRHCPAAEIEIGCNPEPNGELVFFVRDNGAGFDMRYYNKLFEIFQRLHSEREFEGTGIGLAIVRRVAERHGGRVWAEGAVGAGATFYFALPHDSSCMERGSNDLEANLVS